ncbi:MAG TPA: restriction endonuclease subunit S [Alphaproteobacteria bacterium]|nr:restriction endonuclease subunit S [Alphaproteobacteria bacterium]
MKPITRANLRSSQERPDVSLQIADAFRGGAASSVKNGAMMALLLRWSQSSEGDLRGMPPLMEASADFIAREMAKILRVLHPEGEYGLPNMVEGLGLGEIEHFRRIIVDNLEARVPLGEIAEAILENTFVETWISKESCALIITAMDSAEGATIRCAFSYAIHPAWELSKKHTVFLDIENLDSSRILSLLAATCGYELNIQVKSIISAASEDDIGRFDHALIMPPLGMKLNQGGLPYFTEVYSSEALGAVWGARLGRKRNLVIVGNGLLFRTSSRDSAFKQDLINKYGLESVLALPRGAFPRTVVAGSILVFSGTGVHDQGSICFLDTTEPTNIDGDFLRKLLKGKERHSHCVRVPYAELLGSGFNLSVERYVLDDEARRNLNLLKQQELLTLADLAEIHRPQALPRGNAEGGGFMVREALLVDIDDGLLSLPNKLSELPTKAAPQIEEAILKPNDILLSIKGTIGKAALVTEDIIKESGGVPIVAGQSCVIIRLRKKGAVRDPRVLFAYLRSPLAQSLLQGMAGGTTIQNVAMGGLKNLAVPVIPFERQELIITKYQEYERMQRELDKLREKKKRAEAHIYEMAQGAVSQ